MQKEGPLKDVVKKIIGNLEKKETEELDLVKIWEGAVGKKAATHTQLALFKSKRLIVNVSNSSWLYKLTADKKKLIEALNAKIKGRRKVKELQFRIGQI